MGMKSGELLVGRGRIAARLVVRPNVPPGAWGWKGARQPPPAGPKLRLGPGGVRRPSPTSDSHPEAGTPATRW